MVLNCRVFLASPSVSAMINVCGETDGGYGHLPLCRPILSIVIADAPFGPSEMACFSTASFNNSYWRATYILMVNQVRHVSNRVSPPRASPGISIFICGLKGVLTFN